MKPRAIIFDLDGVLVHTDELHYRAWKKLADHLCLPFDRKINERLRGVSRMQSLEIVLGENSYTAEEKVALAEEKNAAYRELLKTLRPADVSFEVLETLSELRRRGLKLAVGSSSKNARTILEQTALADFFDAVSDGNNITRSKPDPEVFLKAAAMLGEAPRDCLVVEDAQAGIEAANAGGFISAGIASAAASPDAKIRLNTFRELLVRVSQTQ